MHRLQAMRATTPSAPSSLPIVAFLELLDIGISSRTPSGTTSWRSMPCAGGEQPSCWRGPLGNGARGSLGAFI